MRAVLFLAFVTLAAVVKAQKRHNLDGGILIADQKNRGRIVIMDGSVGANWGRDSAVLWSWNVRDAKGVPSADRAYFRNLFPRFNDAKRAMIDGKIHIIITGNGGDGVATIEMASGRVVYYANVGGGPHSVALTPDGNMACADSKLGHTMILNTQRNKRGSVQTIKHAGSHGVLWDARKKVMWSWGGARMIELRYNNNRNQPRFTVVRNNRIPQSWGNGGGHDLTPWGGTTKMIFSWREGIGTFDTSTNKFEKFRVANGVRTGNAKGVSWNQHTKEMIYTRPDTSVTSQSSRTHRVRSDKHKDRLNRSMSYYKARWWIHNVFSYP